MFKHFSNSDLAMVAILLDEEEGQEIEMAKKKQKKKINMGSRYIKKTKN